jgi:hypothetical protein
MSLWHARSICLRMKGSVRSSPITLRALLAVHSAGLAKRTGKKGGVPDGSRGWGRRRVRRQKGWPPVSEPQTSLVMLVFGGGAAFKIGWSGGGAPAANAAGL